MKVYTKIVIDMLTDAVLEEEFFEYDGPVALCKDHGQDAANAQRKEELALQRDAYNRENQRMDTIQNSLGKYLSGDVGFSPEQMAALKTQFLNSNAQNYNDAGANVRSALARQGSAGGNMPVGGDYVRGIAGLEGSEASARSQGMTGIDIQNLQQALANKFNTASVLSGNAATLSTNVGQFGQGAASALNNYVQAKSIPGFGEVLSSSFAKALGNTLGGGNLKITKTLG